MSLAGVTGMESIDDAPTIGCVSCTAKEAQDVATCASPYHLCSQQVCFLTMPKKVVCATPRAQEIYVGPLHIARTQGWLVKGGGDLWLSDLIPTEPQREGEVKRMALCCPGQFHQGNATTVM